MYSFSNYYKLQKHRAAELKKKLQVFHNICLKKNFCATNRQNTVSQ